MRPILLVLALLLAPPAARAQTCPAVIAGATRLALVTAANMHTGAASLRLYRRASPAAPWHPLGAPHAVRLGEYGMAWGAGFQQVARRGEPVKRERDWRTPAGIYRIGAPFGFAASGRPGYVRLRAGETFCVDDVRSPAYNTITTVAKAGRVTGERMRGYPQYRHGLFVDYPSTHSKPAGSCIFIHVWNAPSESTAGCIAMPASHVVALQDFAQTGAVLAVLPKRALRRFEGCLPQ